MTPQDELRRREFGEGPPLRDLVGNIIDDLRGLLRGELALARAEVDDKIERSMIAIGSIIGGIFLAFTALNVLLAAVVSALIEAGMAPWLASVIVGVVVAGIGFLLVRQGIKALSLSKLVPERTAANLQADARLVRDQVK